MVSHSLSAPIVVCIHFFYFNTDYFLECVSLVDSPHPILLSSTNIFILLLWVHLQFQHLSPLGFPCELFIPERRPLCVASVSVICWVEPHSKAQYSLTHPGLLCWLHALQQDPSCFPDLRLLGNNLPWTKQQIICLCRFWKQVMANQCYPKASGRIFSALSRPW